ncbi:hypothetical protein AJ78_04596, partial [Emergomyces pasteurianus Ep9510]
MERVLLLSSLLLGVITSTNAEGQNDRSDCVTWCATKFSHSVAECIMLAGQGEGPCYECGPFRDSDNWQYRNGECVEIRKDDKDCEYDTGSGYCVPRPRNSKYAKFAPTTFRTSIARYFTE